MWAKWGTISSLDYHVPGGRQLERSNDYLPNVYNQIACSPGHPTIGQPKIRTTRFSTVAGHYGPYARKQTNLDP